MTILGGRFLMQNCRGTMFGQPYEGLGITGYDRFKKKFVGLWLDSLSTAILAMSGTCSRSFTSCMYTARWTIR